MKSKQTQTTNQTQTMTPNNPGYVTGGLESLTGDIMGLRNLDPYSLVPGATPLQQQGAAITGGLTGSPWNWDKAADFARQVGGAAAPTVNAESLLTNLGSYENPFINDVVNTTLSGFDQNAGRTRAAQDLAIAGQGAFGGSGAALTKSLTESQLGLDRASTEAGLRFTAKDKAFGYSGQDADRRQSASTVNAANDLAARQQKLQAAGLLGDISSGYDANQRANAGQMFDMGEIMRQIQQQQAQAPISTTADIASIFGSLPYGLTQGQTTTGSGTAKTTTGGSLAQMLGMGLQAAALFSDVRLKRDIRKVGDRPDGLGLYRYRYLWSDEETEGVMAHEVMMVKPEAVSVHPSGYLMVNYDMLGA